MIPNQQFAEIRSHIKFYIIRLYMCWFVEWIIPSLLIESALEVQIKIAITTDILLILSCLLARDETQTFVD